MHSNYSIRPNNTQMSTLVETERLLLNPLLSNDWRVRTVVKEKLEECAMSLPDGICLMVFEAFRSAERQQQMWDIVYRKMELENPTFSKQQLHDEASHWVSPPDGFGSGHLSGAAVDVTLATSQGEQLDMGTDIQEFNALTPTQVFVNAEVYENRKLLVKTLERQGMINYPYEWWHFSYGDRLWAELTQKHYLYFTPNNTQ